MSNAIHRFDCPCCGKRIEFDVRSQKARAVKVTESRVSKDFDTLLADQTAEKARLEGAFGSAIEAQKRQGNALDAMFEDAKRRAKEDPEDDPPRPMDLD